jgi:DNA replication protein DnaC
MLQEPMMEKLTAMRLLGMVDALKAQEQDPAAGELSFMERLGLLVDQQWTWRENQALARRLHAAKLKGASVEDIDYRTSRGLDKSVIRALAQKSVWAANHENIFVLGPTGVGKSFVACTLAQKACRDGYSALYLRAAALFRDLANARADGSLRSLLARLSRIDALVRGLCVLRRGQGLPPLSPHPFLRSAAAVPPLRSGQVSLDEAEHFRHNRVASVATLR